MHKCSVVTHRTPPLTALRVSAKDQIVVNNVFIIGNFRTVPAAINFIIGVRGRCCSDVVVFRGFNALLGVLARGARPTRALVGQCVKDSVAILRSDTRGQDTV